MNEKDILLWSKDSSLSWSDFQADPHPAAYEDAYSFLKYRCTWTVNSESFGNEIRFCIKDIQMNVEFHRHLSWVREQLATPSLLSHQQGHFDLAHYYIPKIIQQLYNVFENHWYPTRGQNEDQRKQFAREDSAILIAKELEKWDEYVDNKQKEYDQKTDYGQLAEKQKEFDLKFSSLRK